MGAMLVMDCEKTRMTDTARRERIRSKIVNLHEFSSVRLRAAWAARRIYEPNMTENAIMTEVFRIVVAVFTPEIGCTCDCNTRQYFYQDQGWEL